MGYTPIDENNVEKDYIQKRIISFPMYIEEELPDVVDQLSNTPAPKTEPDQETLDFWNEFNANPDEIQALKDRVGYVIYEVLKPIYDEGKMPSDWVTPYLSFKDWYDNL